LIDTHVVYGIGSGFSLESKKKTSDLNVPPSSFFTHSSFECLLYLRPGWL